MPSNTSRIHILLQYALLVAGEEDHPFDRQLGPIHLIKYVYLADLYYARRNQGETFTGADWRFYNFGPWSPVVYEQIEPALLAINADKKVMDGDYGEKQEWVRYWFRDEQLLSDKERQLPPEIKLHLRREIHKYGSDTTTLLDYIYKTKPMISAAPNEYLDFLVAIDDSSPIESQALRIDNASNKKKKKFKVGMQKIQQSYNDKKASKGKLVPLVKEPVFDEIYDEGVAWLNQLAGPEITPGEKSAHFSDEVWKSSTRKGEDVS